MKIVVLKFGGTSVERRDRIKKLLILLAPIKEKAIMWSLYLLPWGTYKWSNKKIWKVSRKFQKTEYHTLVSAGEQISCSLIAGSLITLVIFQNHDGLADPHIQMTITVMQIKGVNTSKIREYLKKDGIPIIAGFQHR